jgi:hypothetical protein
MNLLPHTGAFYGLASQPEQRFEFGGRTWAPDEATAYLLCTLSHTIPTFTWYGEGLAPDVVRGGWQSILHKPLNREHQMRAHDPKTIARDRVIGCTVAATCGLRDVHTLPATMEETQGIDVLACVFKQAEGVPKLLGEHLTARKTYTVSMEVRYFVGQSGFLVDTSEDSPEAARALAQESGAEDTPSLWKSAGWMYVPVQRAGEDLLATRCLTLKDGVWQASRNRMRDRRPDGKGFYGIWKDHRVWWLMGGLGGEVSYNGVGVVGLGAEPTAQITQMVAHRPEDELEAQAAWLTALGEALKKI